MNPTIHTFPGLTKLAQQYLQTMIQEATSKGVHQLLSKDPDFTILDAVTNSSRVLDLLKHYSSTRYYPGESPTEVEISNILNVGVQVVIDLAGEDLKNLDTPGNEEIIAIFRELLSKINIDSITGEQLVWLGDFFVHYKGILEGKEYIPSDPGEYPGGNANLRVSQRKKAVQRLISDSDRGNNIDYFTVMGKDLIRLGKSIYHLENIRVHNEGTNEITGRDLH